MSKRTVAKKHTFYEAIVKVPHPQKAIRESKRWRDLDVGRLDKDPRDGLTEIAITSGQRRYVSNFLVLALGWKRKDANEKITRHTWMAQ